MTEELKRLFSKIQSYNTEADFGLIEKAYSFAQSAHSSQKRLSGDPFFVHPLAVANILADYKLDTISIVAGFLHDTLEDCEVSKEEIEKEFGESVLEIVEGVTKIGEISLRGSSEESFVENLRKMLLAMSKDLRVILVRLADRYHNMQTLQYLPPEKRIKNAKETLEVYAPLAERLGMGEMKGSLEDLAFPYVYPEEYKWLIEHSRPYYKKAEEFLEKATREVYKKLAEDGIRVKITSRSKHLYSLWRKLLRPEIDKDINRVYDLVAMRILTDSVRDCYATLGIVHSLWKPIPAIGIRDFIAQPKPNGYRSIHTTVFSFKERITEVQIRTFEMHEEAEYGVAAHWQYAEAKTKGVSGRKLEAGVFTAPDKLSWVKQLVVWQNEVVDSKEFLEALRFDALTHRIFIFSPKGDVYDLPEGATPVDFAYAVHSDLGNQTYGSLVNGKMVSLDHKLKSGDMVEIIKKEGVKPSEKWLRFVTTQLAKNRISRYLREKS
ncbi:bifunctional (p)ppGpp synthetase/guanosine-3',5'-bis(diphosphate) 3'-pyrophosphohydrolase [Candidatus Microgenomates bacterium]|jgi:GTP pyrophosphokinase|nr:MAG: bifunctional (p)ppGpp synthetase/guanosine-3',5'-bis(diphosphate) 3'-pyrophosphohydrolase [Candidatus Microgenomates bacterium]